MGSVPNPPAARIIASPPAAATDSFSAFSFAGFHRSGKGLEGDRDIRDLISRPADVPVDHPLRGASCVARLLRIQLDDRGTEVPRLVAADDLIDETQRAGLSSV